MTKDDAFKIAEQFFLRNYTEKFPEYCALAMTKCAEKDAAWVCRAMESFIDFEQEIARTLKKKE